MVTVISAAICAVRESARRHPRRPLLRRREHGEGLAADQPGLLAEPLQQVADPVLEREQVLAAGVRLGGAEQRDRLVARTHRVLEGEQHGQVGLLDERPAFSSLPHELWQASRRGDLLRQTTSILEHLRHEADATVVRGLIALEAGDLEEAETAFRLALAFRSGGRGVTFDSQAIAETCLGWLK